MNIRHAMLILGLLCPFVAGAAEKETNAQSVFYFQLNESKSQNVPITTVQAEEGRNLGQFQIVARIENAERWSDDYFLLTSIELIAAPRMLPPELKGTDITQSVGWGYLTTMQSLHAQIAHDQSSTSKELHTVAILNLDEIIRESFSVGDGLWPWAFRTTVYALDRYGKTIFRGTGILRVNPPMGSGNSSPMPNKPLQETR